MLRFNSFMNGDTRRTLPILQIVCLMFLVLHGTNSIARDVSFVWSENPETVDGYRLYYKTGTSGAPYDGTGASEGPSPITTGNVTTYILHNLSDSEPYYFTLTAFLGAEESSYSTEIYLPADTVPPTVGRNISFVWTANSETVDGYRLYYKDIAIGNSCPLPADVSYNSQDATNGQSPLDAGNVTTFTVQGLSLDKAYCFALTAYLDGQESDYTQPIQLTGNNPPVASTVLVSTIENITVTGQLPASDADGDTLTFSIVNNGNLGTASITNTANGAFSYTPNTGVSGSDSFSFKVNDGVIDSNTANVTVTINAANVAPTATGGFFITDKNTPALGQLLGSDPDGDTLTYTIVTNGTKGSAVITNINTGAFTYTPNTDVTGSDSFTFKVNDGTVDSAPAPVNVTINAVNEAPAATGGTIATDENTPYTGQLTATDADGDALTYTIVTNGTKGSAVITNINTGAFTYTPNTDVTGSDSFTFKVNDGTVDSAPAPVNVTINAVNEAPAATGGTIATDANTLYTGQLTATDADGDALTYTIVANGTKGSAVITNINTGAFTYTPNTDVSGSDSFAFKVNDGTVDSVPATMNVTINVVNEIPRATGGTIATDANTLYTGQLTATDADGDALTYTIVTNGAKGSAVITNINTGVFTYTPNTDASGSDSFTFKVNDGTVDSAPATMNVTINVVNEAPVVADISISTDLNVVHSGQLSAIDADADTLTYTIVTNGTIGTAAITDSATGAFTYTPNTNATGSDSFTFKVNDGTEDSAEGTVTVVIFEAVTITKVFSDTLGADYPGTFVDTFTNINTDVNADLDTIETYSWYSSPPHKVANTIIIKVDLGAIQTYATVIEAKLILYQTSSTGEIQYNNTIHKITGKNPIVDQVTGYNAFNGEAWTPVPAGTTHDNIPLGLADIEPQEEDSTLLFTQEGFRSWIITNMVQEWVSTPSLNYGLLIKGEETLIQTGRGFASTENNNETIRPKLVVRYRLIPPAPKLILIEEIK